MIYTLNNPTEEHMTDYELITEAEKEFIFRYKSFVYRSFVIETDVYLVTRKADVYKSTTLSRNEAELGYFGSLEDLSSEKLEAFINALRVIATVTR